MLYYKDPKIKYTDMCIYFDWNFYNEDRDEWKLYEYLYLICLMLARTKSTIKFNNNKEFDEFGSYAAGIIWCRIEKKLQWEGVKVKSILNYARGSIYGIFRCWQKDSYYDISDKREYLDNSDDLLSQLDRNKFNQDIDLFMENTFSNLKETFTKWFNKMFPESNWFTCIYLYQQFLLNLNKIFKIKWNKNPKVETRNICKNLIKLKYKSTDKSLLGYDEFMNKFTSSFANLLKDEVYETYQWSLLSYEDALAIQKENVTNALIDKSNGD